MNFFTFTIFTLLFTNSVFAGFCTFEVIEKAKKSSQTVKPWRLDSKGRIEDRYQLKKVTSDNYEYTFTVIISSEKVNADFSREPLIENSGKLKSGLSTNLVAQGDKLEIESTRIDPFGTKEPSYQFTMRKIQTAENEILFLFDSLDGDQVRIKCTSDLIKSSITYNKAKNTKGARPTLTDNSGTCSVKIQDKLSKIEEDLDKNETEINTFEKTISSIYDGKELRYGFEVKLSESEYFIKVHRLFPPMNIMKNNVGSMFKTRIKVNSQGELVPYRYDSQFEMKNRTRTEKAFQASKFVLSKLYKPLESPSIYLELTKDGSRILISCTSSLLKGEVVMNEKEVGAESNDQFLKRVDNNSRQDFKPADVPTLLKNPEYKKVLNSN